MSKSLLLLADELADDVKRNRIKVTIIATECIIKHPAHMKVSFW